MKSPTSIKVLIVEDVPDMRELVRETLRAADSILISGLAGDVSQARLEIANRRPDVVLLDEILPGESSDSLLKECLTQGIPVVLMTGMSDPKGSRPPLPPGVTQRVGKPGWDQIDHDRARLRDALLKASLRT